MSAASKVEVAQANWGVVPDWVMALARACDASTQAAVAGQIGYSAAVVSTVIKQTYAGNWKAVEDKVRGALMGAVIACPELGNMPLDQCRLWRSRSGKFSSVNPMRVRMYRACNHCPHNQKTEA